MQSDRSTSHLFVFTLSGPSSVIRLVGNLWGLRGLIYG